MQTLSPRLNDSLYLRREVGGFNSPQQTISKRVTANYMLRNRYNKVMDAGSMYGTVQAGRGDRTRNERSGLNQGNASSGRGGRFKDGGLKVEVTGLAGKLEPRVTSGKSTAQRASILQQDALYTSGERGGRVQSAVNKVQVLSDHSQRRQKETFKSQDKLTNVSSAKSIRVQRAI